MFKNATDTRDPKKYRKLLRSAMKRLKKLQTARNARDDRGGGGQSNDVSQFVRLFADFTFNGEKSPAPLLLIGKKTVINKIGDELIEGDGAPKGKGKAKGKDEGKGKDEPKAPGKKAKGVCYFHAPSGIFYFKFKGAAKASDLAKVMKKAGIRDPFEFGEATDEDEERATASEAANEELDASLGEAEEPEDEEDEAEVGVGATTEDQAKESPEVDAAAALKERIAKVKAQFDEFKTSDPTRAQPIGRLLAQAVTLTAKGFEGAAQMLDDVEKRLAAAKTPTPTTGSKPESEGDEDGARNALVEKYRPRVEGVVAAWEQARATASLGADDLSRRLRATGDVDAVRAADVVDGLAAEFPDGLDAALDDIRDAIKRNDGDALGDLCESAEDHVKDCLQYLKDNRTLIGYCENNAFGAGVSISEPLVKALQDVLAGLK
jgi:hypothetical protein